MGYPASAALLFKALTEEEDKWLHGDAKEIVNKFSLFSIILADPVKDLVFYEQLQMNFPFYDRLTGNNFMFFSIVKEADTDRFEGAHKRFRIFHDTEAYKQNHAAEEVRHSELVIHAICTILGVDYDQTPCLIISNDLRFGNYCKIKTNINDLEAQLVALRGVADNKVFNKSHSLLETLNMFNQQQRFFNEIEELDVNRATIKAVSEILQAVSCDNLFQDKSLSDLKSNLEKITSPFVPSDLNEKIIEIRSLLSLSNKKSLVSPSFYKSKDDSNTISDINHECRTSDTNSESSYLFADNQLRSLASNAFARKMYNEWANVQPSTKNYLQAALFLITNMNESFSEFDDYSIYALPICKSFETEIKYSVVQLMRKNFGIDMPDYFAKYCPKINNLPVQPLSTLVKSVPRNVYLNSESKGEWIAPGLGESRLIFETIRHGAPKFGTQWMATDQLDMLNKKWEIVQKIRNKTTHTEIVNGNDKINLEMSLIVLLDKGILNKITWLKLQLSQ